MAPQKWSMGVLNDRLTDEVPGSVILIPHSTKQEPLGFPAENESETTDSSSNLEIPEKKRTKDGKFILDPQPDDNPNDPLNWVQWRRDAALLSLGWHCLIGGGQTTILAAGFKQVSIEFDVTFAKVALTTGLYMLGLGMGSLFSSPLAILFGKRPVYLLGVLIFLGSSIWCATAKNYYSLLVARIMMGFGVSPCESLPSATIAEIFFLHERAYRVGIYTLLLLGGKNVVPLVSAIIINANSWRWVFWVVTIIVCFNLFLIFFFVPETFWDRAPSPAKHKSLLRRASSIFSKSSKKSDSRKISFHGKPVATPMKLSPEGKSQPEMKVQDISDKPEYEQESGNSRHVEFEEKQRIREKEDSHELGETASVVGAAPVQPGAFDLEKHVAATEPKKEHSSNPRKPEHKISYLKSLSIWNGRLRQEKFLCALRRPIILFMYPAILWSTAVYSLSLGWLIVLSESVAHVYQYPPYKFTPLQTGLVYLSPLIGGILGTAVAGKLSDIIVRYMARKNGGLYEPEFRLVMGLPVAVCTAMGLIGFGWSAQSRDSWIVPTIFFGIISFGCTLGSTTAITFALDSYRQFAGEALVTLNFSKNVFHGFVFSLFFNNWLQEDGSRKVFIALGGIQLALLSFTIPLYIFGKQLRMWTFRRDWSGRWS